MRSTATVLRVCATPSNLPYSNEKGEGFENKIAAVVADELKVPVENTLLPQGLGFIRMTLAAKKCDIVIGTAQADEFTQNTNAYYRTTYALLYKEGKGPRRPEARSSIPASRTRSSASRRACPPPTRSPRRA